jgi:hypothetical protein
MASTDPGMLEYRHACGCQCRATTRTVDERHAEIMLKLSDLGAHPRLTDVYTFGCASEIRFLSHRNEVLQLSQFHIP